MGSLLLLISSLAGAVLSLFGLYQLTTAMFGARRPRQNAAALPKTRFAVLVAARNEEGVVGQLLDSLKEQNYPPELFDVYVAPNNCTDDTAGVAKAHGAQIFNVMLPVRSKGEVLCQLVDFVLESKRYDAICVFDADNLVHSDFLQKMNDACAGGARAAQCFRGSKNPADSAVATCHAIGFWLASRFYNGGHQAWGLSSLMSGSGIMVDCGLLQRMGGWHTTTITEDYEFTAQAALLGEQVHYVHEAIIYDEQPITLKQSWKQRRRWSSGHVQGMEKYLPALARHAWGGRSGLCADLALMYASPLLCLASLANGAFSSAVMVMNLAAQNANLLAAFGLAAFVLAAAYVVCTFAAAFAVHMHMPGNVRRMWRGILFFAPFLLTCAPIMLASIVKRQKVWEPIAHTRALTMGDMAA